MSGPDDEKKKKADLRSKDWFGNSSHPDMTALYLERYMNNGRTLSELRSSRPIIGIAQTGSDLAPCNRHLIDLADRIRDGIRDAGGIPMEFPVHPMFENARRPTAALDRNLAFLGLVEVLRGHPLDGVVLTTGCDKTTPACLMAAAATDTPAIVMSGGPMLNGWRGGERVGSGTIVWEGRRRFAAGEISEEEFIELAAASAPSIGHCNTMGTALSMNGIAEALGMSLTGCSAIPAPYRERGQMAYETGKRAVAMVEEELRPSKILTRDAFLNAIRVATTLGASSNCPPHLIAIARHAGVELSLSDWQEYGEALPLLVDVQPAGQFLAEEFHRAGGVAAVMAEMLQANHLNGDVLTVSGLSVRENLNGVSSQDHNVIRPFQKPLAERAGFLVMRGNFFDTAILKSSVIDESFREQYMGGAGQTEPFVGRVTVFEGPEDYRDRIDDPDLNIDARSVLVIRNCGPIGYPGSAEVVNMLPPKALIEQGVMVLPTMGDGRQSGTSGSPSILNMTPEAAIGGGLSLLRDGDQIKFDFENGRADLILDDELLEARKATADELSQDIVPETATPWEKLYRQHSGGLDTGACLDFATAFQRINATKLPRHNH